MKKLLIILLVFFCLIGEVYPSEIAYAKENTTKVKLATPKISTCTNTSSGVSLTWNKVKGAKGYAIYRKTYGGNASWKRIKTIKGNSTLKYTDTAVVNKNGTAYCYTVRALAGSDLKTMSGYDKKGCVIVRLSEVTLRSATAKSFQSVTCKWKTSSKVTGYQVRILKDSEVVKTVTGKSAKTSSKTFDGLEPGTTYTVQVRGYKTVKNVGKSYSAWSEAMSVTTPEIEPQLVSVSSKEAVNAVLAKNTIKLANALPDAAWNDLPVWNGVTLSNMIQYDWPACGQPQEFSKEDIENIAALGFNFIRVPIDTRLFYDMEDPSKIRLDRLLNLDSLISWCAEFGVHLCPDVHFSFGFTTDGNEYNDTIWVNEEEQELFVEFWALLAERYKDVPTNLLSFNLMNEPVGDITEEQYVTLMRRAISVIREYTPDRLIFVDMFSCASEPVESLVKDEVAQSFHFYMPHLFTHSYLDGINAGSWPMYQYKNTIKRINNVCDFRLTGEFSAGTKLEFTINSIHKSGTLIVEADGKKIYEWEFGKDAVGENHCLRIYEEGTDGEYRDYYLTHNIVLPNDTSELYMYVKDASADDWCWWFTIDKLKVLKDNKTYYFEGIYEPTMEENSPNPNIVFNEDGSVSDSTSKYFGAIDKEYMNNRFAEYEAFAEKTGVEVMLQEFGVYYKADYNDTLKYFDDIISAANENNLNWCGWDYFGIFSFYAVNDFEMRKGATYEPFSNGYMATEIYDIFKNHLKTSKGSK